MNQHGEQLRILSIFHYVVAAMAGLISLFPMIHLVIGILMVSGVIQEEGDPFPLHLVGWLMIALASCFMLAGFTFSVCLALAGRYLNRRKHYTFCLVMSGLACMFMPFGTVLGVFTIILLTKQSVKEEFVGASLPE